MIRYSRAGVVSQDAGERKLLKLPKRLAAARPGQRTAGRAYGCIQLSCRQKRENRARTDLLTARIRLPLGETGAE